MLPWAIRRRSASRRHVDELDLVGRAHDRVGDRLLLLDAGDLLDDVVHRLEVLDVHGGDHVDPGVEELLDVLPALLVARARARWCARARRPARPSGLRARTASTSISSKLRAAVARSSCRGTTSRSPICAAVFGRPWVSTKPTTTSVPRSRASPALVEHGEGLADAGRGTEVDAQRAARHASRAYESRRAITSCVEGEVELEHVDRLLAEEPERAARRVVVDRAAAPAPAEMPRTSATRGACRRALATEMSGSSPEPDAVTASTGTFTSVAESVQLAVGLDPVARPSSGSRGWSARGSSPLLQRAGRSPRRSSPVGAEPRPTAGTGSTWRSGCPWRR